MPSTHGPLAMSHSVNHEFSAMPPSERALRAIRTATIIKSIHVTVEAHPTIFSRALDAIAHEFVHDKYTYFWGHPRKSITSRDLNIEDDGDLFRRLVLSALPPEDQDLHKLFDIFADIKADSPEREAELEKIRAAALLIVYLLMLDPNGPRLLAVNRSHFLARVPWNPPRGSSSFSRSKAWTLVSTWSEGPAVSDSYLRLAHDAIEQIDPSIAHDLRANPHSTPPQLTNAETLLLRALREARRPMAGASLAAITGMKSHRVPLNRLHSLGYIERTSPRSPWHITESGLERLKKPT